MTLAEYGSFIWVEAAGNIFSQNPVNILPELLSIRVGCERMEIGYHEITFITLLHLHIVADSAKIIAQVQKTC